MIPVIGGIFASLNVSFFIIWIFGLMAAVLLAGLIYAIGRKLFEIINHWRFLFWLNRLHR